MVIILAIDNCKFHHPLNWPYRYHNYGSYESTYIAAIALGGIVFNFMYAGLNFLRMGTTGIVSQKLGSKDFDEVLLSLLRPLFIALLIGIILFLSKFLFNLSVYFLTPEEKLQILYKEYLFVRMISLRLGC